MHSTFYRGILGVFFYLQESVREVFVVDCALVAFVFHRTSRHLRGGILATLLRRDGGY